MKYIGIKCEACGEIFAEQDDVVVCPVCGAPHHRVCWQKENQCIHHAQHQSGYEWVSPIKPDNGEKTEKSENTTEWKSQVEMPDFVCQNGEKAIVCPKCGALNYANDIYCLRCRQPLKENDRQNAQTQNGNGAYQNAQQQNAGQNTNAAYNAQMEDWSRFGGVDPDSLLDTIPVREYSDYVGGKNPGKIIRRAVLMERFGRKTSFCWPALLLGPIWYLFRKLKKEGIAILGVMLALGVSCAFLQTTQPLKNYYKTVLQATTGVVSGEIAYSDLAQIYSDAQNIYVNADRTPVEKARETAAVVLQYIEMPGIPLVCSLFAIPVYRKKAKAEILQTRTECYDMLSYRQALIAKGGTSVGMAILGVLLYFMIGLVGAYLPFLLSFIG